MTRGAYHKRHGNSLHLALLWAKTHSWKWPGMGICGLVDKWLASEGHDTKACKALLDYLFEQWPEFSGSTRFPVCTRTPARDDTFEGHVAAVQYVTNAQIQSLWHGEYGEARRRLLDFLIGRTWPE